MFEDYGWCLGYALCDAIWGCGAFGAALSTAVLITTWVVIYYIFAYAVYALVEGNLKEIPSKYEGENTRHWFANHMSASVLSVVAIYFALPAVLSLMDTSVLAQFGTAERYNGVYTLAAAQVAKGSQAFLSYVAMDAIVGFAHGTLKCDMLVHHILFMSFGAIVYFNRYGVYLVGVMLLMETSTLFLNYFSFFRNRRGFEDHWTITVSFGLFALTFVLSRLVGMVYVGRDAVSTGDIAIWQMDVMIVFVVMASVLQVWWAVGIGKKVLKQFCRTSISNSHGEYVPMSKEEA